MPRTPDATSSAGPTSPAWRRLLGAAFLSGACAVAAHASADAATGALARPAQPPTQPPAGSPAASPAPGLQGADSLVLGRPDGATLVGPGVVSTWLHDYGASLTPDGRALLFTVTDAAFTRMTLVESTRRDARWTTPRVLPFSGLWNDGDGALSPDGLRLVFASNRPVGGGAGARRDLDLWSVERGADGRWGTPRHLGPAINTDTTEVYPSLAADGTLYFGRALAFYRSVRAPDGTYGTPERLPFRGFSLAIAPSQRFAVFGGNASPTDLDLFAACRTADGWSAPVRLAAPVSSPFPDQAAWVSADERELYLTSQRRTAPAAPAPRAARTSTYSALEDEARAVVENGSRNVFRVSIAGLTEHCARAATP